MPAIDITGLARQPLPQTCTWCGCDAVELLVTRDDPGHEGAAFTSYACRACDPEGFCAPDAETLLGDAVDHHEPMRLFTPAPNTMPGQLTL